jgi:hypothetical protein
VSGSATTKHYVEVMTSIGLVSEYCILPAKVTVKDDPMEIVTTEHVSGDEWVQKLYGNSNLDKYPAVLKLAFNVPWFRGMLKFYIQELRELVRICCILLQTVALI